MKTIHLEHVDSTNLEARRLVETGERGPVWVRADRQTGGRGRRGRDWVSPNGNLYCTGLYPFNDDNRNLALYTFAAALAVYDIVAQTIGSERVVIKWPNDVLINGAKCSGILLESGVSPNQEKWLIVGIGINVGQAPQLSDRKTAALSDHNPNVSCDVVFEALTASFSNWAKILQTQGFEPLRQAWLSRAGELPRPVRVSLPKEEFEGLAIGLDAEGALQVKRSDGTLRSVHAGDVFFSGENNASGH